MNRRIVIALAAVVVIIVAAAVIFSLTSREAPLAGPSTPSGGATPVPPATSTPDPSSTPAESEEGFDEDFGDTVVDVGDDGEAEFENGLEASLVSVKETEVSGSGVGAANGDGYDIVIELENDSSKTIDLSAAVVNAYTGEERTPATPAEGKGAKPFSAKLAPGATVRGHYFFGVAATGVVLRVTLSTSAESGLVVLERR